jgi:hypothetical protein
MKRICYIPLREDEDLLRQAIVGLYDQVDSFRVINSTQRDLTDYLKEVDPVSKISFIEPFSPLCFEQALNTAIKNSILEGDTEFIVWGHNDIIVQPGAVDALVEKYEEVKGTKWGVIYGMYDTLCLFNPRFFIDENIWGDPSLFPNYFGDNHRYRLMDLRGYSRHECSKAAQLVKHIGSQTITRHPYYGIINGMTFDLEGQLYRKIWGGGPGSETVTDPTCYGLYPINR